MTTQEGESMLVGLLTLVLAVYLGFLLGMQY